MTEILRLEGITKTFGRDEAVINSLDMNIETGKISAIIGPNGAGKTTVFNIICGYELPDSGRIRYKGNDITKQRPWKRSAGGIGRFFQDIRIFKKLTVVENLLVTFNDNSENPFKAVFGNRTGLKKMKEIAMDKLEFVGLTNKEKNLAEDLSWGQQKLLSLARLLCGNFELLLIDEPASGVNQIMARTILDRIGNLKKLGKTIIIVEHDMNVVGEIADYIFYMDSGRILASGLPDKILNNQDVMSSYLGD